MDSTTSSASITSTRSKGSMTQARPDVSSGLVKASPTPQSFSISSRVVRPGKAPRKLAGSIESVGISSGVTATGAVTDGCDSAMGCSTSAGDAASAGGAGSVGFGRVATRSVIQRRKLLAGDELAAGAGVAGAATGMTGGAAPGGVALQSATGRAPPRRSAGCGSSAPIGDGVPIPLPDSAAGRA